MRAPVARKYGTKHSVTTTDARYVVNAARAARGIGHARNARVDSTGNQNTASLSCWSRPTLCRY